MNAGVMVGQHPYLDKALAAALAASSGAVRLLPVASWDDAPLLVRRLPAAPGVDAAGCYPMLPFFSRWDVRDGAADLARHGVLSAVFVSDPALPPADAASFDYARPFKTHYLVRAADGYMPSSHHAQEIRRAARRCSVEEVRFGAQLGVWLALYRGLVADKGFSGAVQDFGDAYFAALARLGVRAWLARCGDVPVAMALWVRHDRVAYYHLAAGNAQGRRSAAAYVLVDAAIRALIADGVEEIVLGGSPGAADAPQSGLARFKAGFANACAANIICGLVLDRARYAALAAASGAADPAWFPVYRAPAQMRAA